MKNRTFRAILTAVVVALALLLGAGAVQAAEIITDGSGTNATGILGLDVEGTFYDVEFVYNTPTVLYGWPDTVFPFDDEEKTDIANIAVIDALNTVPAVVTVGPTDSESDKYLIGHELDTGAGDDEYVVTEAKYATASSLWEESSSTNQNLTDFGTYADFTVAEVEVGVVPDVVGLRQTDAEDAIEAADFTVGEVTEQIDDIEPAGVVISQHPEAESEEVLGSEVDLVVSLGPGIEVPDVVDQMQENAETMIRDVGLTVGNVTPGYSSDVAEGEVISQNPIAGTEVALGSAVDLVVSLGPGIEVPDVVDLMEAAAGTAITDAGLTVGPASGQSDDGVPVGAVISQDPAAGTRVGPDSPVNLVISTGPAQGAQVIFTEKLAGKAIGITNLEIDGMLYDVAFAEQQTAAGIYDELPGNFTFTTSESAAAAVDAVNVALNENNALTVGEDNQFQTVFNIKFNIGWASEGTGNLAQVSTRASEIEEVTWASTGKDESFIYNIDTRTFATFTVVGSSVVVPNVVGQMEADAGTAIEEAKLTVGEVTQENSAETAGTVISQTPAAGEEVAPGSPVDLVISLGPAAQVDVPNIVELRRVSAVAAIVQAGLTVGDVTRENNSTVPRLHVISQNPAGGTIVEEGSPVDLVLSKGPAIVTVPDVVGQVGAAAEIEIRFAGLTRGEVTTEYSSNVPAGLVISQDPIGGTTADQGSAVDFVISQGPVQVAVPDVVGQPQADAQVAITGAGLIEGVVTEENSSEVAAGSVIRQNPTGGTTVNEGSPVDLVVSLGPVQVTLPEVRGMPLVNATADLNSVGLTVGVVGEEYSTELVDWVLSQNPAPPGSVDEGSAVDLVVSKGPAAIVPNVVDQMEAAARTAIVDAGLTVGTVTPENSSTVLEGAVISQNPTAGAEVAPGSEVNLVVSLGPVQVTVPDVVGTPQADAQEAITGAGLTVGNMPEENSAETAGTVISQDPAGDTTVDEGSAVDLVISLGPAELLLVETFIGGQFKTKAWKEIIVDGLEDNVANTFKMEAEHTKLIMPVLTSLKKRLTAVCSK